MSTYPQYIDSGVEWIGEIPEMWQSNNIKYVCELITERTNASQDVIKISPENVESFTGKCFNLFSEYNGDGIKFRKGDVLFNKLRVYLVKILYPDFDGLSMGEMIVLRPKEINGKFLYYSIFNQNFINFLDSMATGVKLPRVAPELIINSILPFPSRDEQTQIVAFLDQKLSIIDNLLQKKLRKIELLKEQRTSIINKAVTKGLNPDAAMRDSSVEWIGEIPEHWKKAKFKLNFKSTGGGTPSKEVNEYWNGDIPWVSPKDMKYKYIDNSEDKITQIGLENSTTNLIKEPSLLIVVRSGILQRTIPLGINTIPVTINQDMKSIQPVSGDSIDFLYYFIKGNEENLLKEWSKVGATVESIEMEFMNNTKIPFPPVPEQHQIVEYLDKKTSEIDKQVDLENKKIDLLKEYRQSLISEVVTGKIDVRTN